MLAERGVVSITPRFTAGFSVMRLKWKNGCAITGVTLPIFARGMDETYVKVNGRWAYLYRAVDSRGRTVDFISSRRNSKAAYRFLGKILNNVKK